MRALRKKFSQPSGTRLALATNARFLIDSALKAGRTLDGETGHLTKAKSAKTLWNLRENLELDPRLSTIEAVAREFGLEPWRLLLPGLTEEALLDPGLAKMILSYSKTSPERRHVLEAVLDQFAAR